jgi:hypothetical protein
MKPLVNGRPRDEILFGGGLDYQRSPDNSVTPHLSPGFLNSTRPEVPRLPERLRLPLSQDKLDDENSLMFP